MVTICLANQKGGVGKTTLSVDLAYESCSRGSKTLLVDADPQGSILAWLEKRQDPLPHNLRVIGMATKKIDRDLEAISEDYEIIIIDSPPRVTDIARSAILASDLVIVPCTPSYYDIHSTQEVIDIIREATVFKKTLKYAITINRKIANTIIGKEIKDAVKQLGEDVYVLKTEIHQRVVYATSSAKGLAVQEYEPDGIATKEIKELYGEIILYNKNIVYKLVIEPGEDIEAAIARLQEEAK